MAQFFRIFNKEVLNIFKFFSKDKMKIGIISYYFELPTISGVGIHARLLAEFLAKNNCEVHVFCSNTADDSYKMDNIIVHNIGRVRPNAVSSSSRKQLEYFLFESEAVKEVIKENDRRKFEIIHTHGALTKASFILKKIGGIKWIHTFHAIEISRVKKLSKEEKNFADLVSWTESTVNYCDGAIYVSKPIYAQGRRLFTIKKNIIIPNGVDTEYFKFSHIKNKNVLFIGRFSKDKGIEFFPEIIERIMRIPDATITMLAPYNDLPESLSEILHKIRSYEKRFKGRVKIITNPTDQKYLVALYNNCQIYIQPSKYESFGLCILEAMSTGRPVVAFKVGGIPGLIKDFGYAVDSKEEFLSKVETLLKDKKLCKQIGERAHNEAKKYDWDIIAKKTIDFYKVILHG